MGYWPFETPMAEKTALFGPCVICKGEGTITGMFIPKDPEKWPLGKPPEGKTRAYVYLVCQECYDSHDKAAIGILAEQALRKAKGVTFLGPMKLRGQKD